MLKKVTIIAALLLGMLSVQSAQASENAVSGVAPGRAPGVVNLNTATLEQLMLLPGIGPSKAQAIQARRVKQPFRRKEQLLRVRGIGRKTLQRLRPYICVQGVTTLHKKVSLAR